MKDIKNCPYCGRKAHIDSSTWRSYDPVGSLEKISVRFRIACSKCGCCTEWKSSIDLALERWNRRETDA